MNQLIKMDEEYRKWIEDIGKRYKQRQIKASVSVNQEMIGFYWSIGRDIVEKSAESKWGSGFFVNLSKDMRTILPGVQGLSSSNLRYMKKFYELYSDPILPQFVEELKSKEDSINVPQLVGDLSDKELFSIPWGHHRAIIDKCKLDREKSIFFVKKTILNNWSRAVLLNFLDTDLYERQGKAISNFEYALPEPQSDLAQEITKDPYNFDFVAIREDYSEKELKDALMDNITKFLMELGKGFAFVGREYTIPIEGTEEKIDLLFYHLYLHCYVVVEVKIVALYGMPCAGKSTLMDRITDAKVINGSQELRRICGGSFLELSEEEKHQVRIKYTEYINGLNDEVIVSDGHYSFMETVAFTEADGELYDIFIYLYCSPENLKERYALSEKNGKFAGESIESLRQWQEFEINKKSCGVYNQ